MTASDSRSIVLRSFIGWLVAGNDRGEGSQDRSYVNECERYRLVAILVCGGCEPQIVNETSHNELFGRIPYVM